MMWCSKCKRETQNTICEICGSITQEDQFARKDRFIKKLLVKYVESKVDNIIELFPVSQSFLRKKNVLHGSIFDVDDPQIIYKAAILIEKNRLFRLLNRKSIALIQQGIQEYLEFLYEEKVIQQKELTDTTYNTSKIEKLTFEKQTLEQPSVIVVPEEETEQAASGERKEENQRDEILQEVVEDDNKKEIQSASSEEPLAETMCSMPVTVKQEVMEEDAEENSTEIQTEKPKQLVETLASIPATVRQLTSENEIEQISEDTESDEQIQTAETQSIVTEPSEKINKSNGGETNHLTKTEKLNIGYRASREYFSWLQKQPRTISVNGQEHTLELEELKDLYQRIDDYCLRRKITKDSIFNIHDMDELRDVEEVVNDSRSLHFHHAGRMAKFAYAMQMYIKYITEQTKVNSPMMTSDDESIRIQSTQPENKSAKTKKEATHIKQEEKHTAIRVPWDKYETSLLIDTYLRIEKGDISRIDALQQLSQMLRGRAVNYLHIGIDDRFRNYNGMVLQMSRISYFMSDGEQGLNEPSKMFEETVQLYRQDEEEFKSILKEAKTQAGVGTYDDNIEELDDEVSSETELCMQKIYAALRTIPEDRQAHQVMTYIIAYTADSNQRELLLQCFGNENATIDSICSFDRSFSDEQTEQICAFLRWCSFDMQQEISEFIVQVIYNNPDALEVIQLRAQGNSIQMVQSMMNISTHDVELLESQTKELFADRYKKNRLLSKIAAVRDGDMILTHSELKAYFRRDTETMIFLLCSCNDETFYYDTHTESFIVEDETLADRAQAYLEELPDVFAVKSMQQILHEAEEKDGLPAELLTLAIKKSYVKKGSHYRRARYTTAGQDVSVKTEQETIKSNQNTGRESSGDHQIVPTERSTEETQTETIETMFYEWLAAQVSPKQLSDMFIAFNNIDYFCKRQGILTKPLFETPDIEILRGVKATVEENRSFARVYAAKLQISKKAIQYYLTFIQNQRMELPEKTDESQTSSPVLEAKQSQSHEEVKHEASMRVAFIDWLKSKGKPQAIILMQVRTLENCSKIAESLHISNESIFMVKEPVEISRIRMRLMHMPVFEKKNKEHHGGLLALLDQYVEFCKEQQSPKQHVQEHDGHCVTTESQIKASVVLQHKMDVFPSKERKPIILSGKYYELLKEKFPKGFRPESHIDIKKFRKYYAAKYGTELELSDDRMLEEVKRVTIRHGKMLYLPDTMLSERKKEKLLTYINELFAEGKTAIYYTALFQEFSNEFLGERIHNADILKTYLDYVNQGQYYIGRTYVAKDSSVRVNPTDEVLEILRQKTDKPITVQELSEELPHIPQDKIQQAIKERTDIICNKRGENYFHVDAIDLDETELENIALIIRNGIGTQRFITNSELRSAIGQKYPDILERYEAFSDIGIRDALAYKLKASFEFNANIITQKGDALSTKDVYANFCKTRDRFTMGELNLLKQDIGTMIYFDTVYENCIRISQSEFVAKGTITFDIDAVDDAIETYCSGEYLPLMGIENFDGFPFVGVPWNIFLLEHFVSDYSRRFQLLHTGFNANRCVGAIVRKDSAISDFRWLLVNVLADSGHTASQKNALDYLNNMGYLGSHTYAAIGQVLIDAKMCQSKKG